MDLIPNDITTLILINLKKEVDYVDHFYLFRTVSKEWNSIICQSTVKLPWKFWYWLARKSVMDTEVFIPLSFVNIEKIKLYEKYHALKLLKYNDHFKNLRVVNMSPVEISGIICHKLAKLNIPIISTSTCEIVNHKIYEDDDSSGLFKYKTFSSRGKKVTYYYRTVEMSFPDVNSNSDTEEDDIMIRDINNHLDKIHKYLNTNDIRSIVFRAIESMTSDTCKYIINKCLTTFNRIEKIQIKDDFLFEWMDTDVKKLFEAYPCLRQIKDTSAYIERTVSDEVKYCGYDYYSATMTTLNTANQDSHLYLYNGQRDMDNFEGDYIQLSVFQDFIECHNLFTSNMLENITLIRIDCESLDLPVQFIQDNILKIFTGHLILDSSFTGDIDKLCILFKNCIECKITQLTYESNGFPFSDLIQNLVANPQIFFHSDIKQMDIMTEPSINCNTTDLMIVKEYYDILVQLDNKDLEWVPCDNNYFDTNNNKSHKKSEPITYRFIRKN